jgi:uncharacterized membrane protein YccC
MVYLEQLKNELSEKNAKRLNINFLERLIKRLESFSDNCMECKEYLEALDTHINDLRDKQNQLDAQDMKEHRQMVALISSHLEKDHKLLTEGYYTGIYMSMGTCFGLLFGLVIFDDMALWLSIGLCLGLVIGSVKDADAKKKGLTI